MPALPPAAVQRPRPTDIATRFDNGRLALAIEAMAGGVYDWNLDSGQIEASPRALALLGLAPDTALDAPTLTASLHPDDRPGFEHAIGGLLRGETDRLECDCRSGQPDGSWRGLAHNGLVVRDDDGRPVSLVGVVRDVTAPRQREQELNIARDEATAAWRSAKEARDLLSTILDNMNDGVSLYDKDFRLVFGNPQYRAAHRYEDHPSPQPGTSGYETIRKMVERGEYGDVDDVRAKIEEIAFRMWNTNGQRYVRQRQNGKFIEYYFKRLDDGSLLGFYRDMSELKSREAALAEAKETAERERAEAERANQAKSAFLAIMSHEIRTPMNGVLGMIEILGHQGLNAGQQQSLAIMRSSARALLHVIDDVLDFSKIEAGRLELEETAFSLSSLIEGGIETFRPQAIAKGLRLGATLAPGSHDALVGDPTRVRQILFNLVANAIKFTAQGSVEVDAGTKPVGEGMTQVTLTVRDTGIGLADAQRRRLFQPFAQADTSTTRQFGGSGLGLSIVRRLAELMGGEVAVESTPGIGSIFTVTLLLQAAAVDSPIVALARATAGARKSARPRTRPGERPLVLVVDDHPVNREVLMRQLDLIGIASDSAIDGVEALEAWSARDYAGVLADIHMPVMDGYELVRRIRLAEAGQTEDRARPRRRTPVIAVTANAMKGEEEHCLAAGMDAWLAKPVSIEHLRSMLSRWLPLDRAAGPDEIVEARAIDPGVLEAWLGHDRAAIAALMAKFQETAAGSEQAIETALRGRDLAGVAVAAHRLKGAAMAVGAKEAACFAETLEQAGKAGDRKLCSVALGLLVAELRRVRAEIEEAAAAL